MTAARDATAARGAYSCDRMDDVDPSASSRPHVIVIGGGFAGIACVKRLRRAPVDVTLVDRQNHHLFQPLLYQVATAALSPANITAPLRQIFAADDRVRVVLGDVATIDRHELRVELDSGTVLHGDAIVVATGMRATYFGHDEWEEIAPPLKTVDDALEIRRRFLLAFEEAELETDASAVRCDLTFVVIGAGPTGVEMAGALAELSRKSMRSEFRRIDPATTRVILVEGEDRVLPTFHPDSSARAQADLERLGVEVILGQLAEQLDDEGVTLADGRRIECRNVLWAAGVAGSELGAQLGATKEAGGRVEVEDDLSVTGHRNIFVVGDLARVVDPESGEEVPGVAPAAMQMGRFVGDLLRAEARARARGEQPPPRKTFSYFDKGLLATIGRDKAVAEIGGLRFGGLIAWLLWSGVHIAFLIGHRNRILTMLQWIWHYLLYDRAARIITGGRRVQVARPRG